MMRLTREYVGGGLAGLGIGVAIGCYIAAPSPPGLGLGFHGLIVMTALVLSTIGVHLASSAQRDKGTSSSRR